ncbi:alpha/beta hydrolase [Clostridiales bacterium COT073_COT-073]|nr:alpha/beta hydrolase [Clostridiales bacterium COT073_COT-073]
MKQVDSLNVHEFGKQNDKVVVLIHPSVVRWDYFEQVIPLLEKQYHLIVPALPGYDPDSDSEFTSVEEIAKQIGNYLRRNNIDKVRLVYGCSMGGSIALRMAVDQIVKIENVIMDGGITPYQLPWIITRLILVRDFMMLAIGKWGGEKILVRAFTSDQYDEEAIRYIAKCLKKISYQTIWRTFDSCNNYQLPEQAGDFEAKVYYWCAEHELKERNWDIKYMKKFIPGTKFIRLAGIGHGGLAVLKPESFVREIKKIAN